MERSHSQSNVSVGRSRRASKIEEEPYEIEVCPGREPGFEEGEEEEDGADAKSRYFSWPNIVCIILSLIISAFFIFEPQIISGFWKLYAPEETAEYLLNLKNCKVPNLYDGKSELPFMWDVDLSMTNNLADVDFQCDQVQRFSNIQDTQLILLSKMKKKKCCIRDIYRPEVMNSDMYSVSYECDNIQNFTYLADKEFILVQCSHSKNKSVDFNTHALLPMKPSAQEKMKYWNETFKQFGPAALAEERPFSVAVIVISSTSRAHAYRSLPETMALLEGKFHFTVMNGYNIIEEGKTPLSFGNMLPILTGTLGPNLGEWIPYWDNETKLFADFEENKFITMFMDESRKLLRTSQSDPYTHYRYKSFLKQPTDYYMKPFLEAHSEATEALFINRIPAKEHCFGKRTITSYLLRHLLKFQKKFAAVPSFSFSYFAWPQVQHGLEALSRMDSTYFDFFKEFLKTPQVLERTAVFVMSDFGSLNHPYFRTEHGYIERLNPLLMVRLPDYLVRKHPEFKENLKTNSHRLVGPIDVHKTISIFAKVGVPKKNVAPSPRMDDEKEKKFSGKNLFLTEISHERNCSQAYIPEMYCMCGKSVPKNFNGRTIMSKDGQPEKYWRYILSR